MIINNIMKNIIFILIILLCSCVNQSYKNDPLIEIDLRNNLSNNKVVFEDEIKNVEHVFLELTDNAESLVDNILDLCLTDNYIFILSTKQHGVIQFDRDGKFIRKFAGRGSGPAETQMIMSLSSDEKRRQLYVSQENDVLIFSFDGQYEGKIDSTGLISVQYLLEDGIMADIGKEYYPLMAPNMFAFRVFDIFERKVIDSIRTFLNESVPENLIGLKHAYSIGGVDKSYLSYVACSDTIYRLTKDKINAAFHLKTNNSEESKEYLTNIRSRGDMSQNDLMIYDFFETKNSFFFRVGYRNNEEMHLFSYNKNNRQIRHEKKELKPFEVIELNRKMTGIGIDNHPDSNLPIWICKSYLDKNILLQYNTAAEIKFLIKKNRVKDSTIFEKINEDSNPVITIYYLD